MCIYIIDKYTYQTYIHICDIIYGMLLYFRICLTHRSYMIIQSYLKIKPGFRSEILYPSISTASPCCRNREHFEIDQTMQSIEQRSFRPHALCMVNSTKRLFFFWIKIFLLCYTQCHVGFRSIHGHTFHVESY